MAIELSYSSEVSELVEKTRAFIEDVVLPIEDGFGGDIAAAGGDAAVQELQAAAREAGVFAPHAPGRVRRPGLEHVRPGAGVRGGRLLAVRSDRR